MKLHIVGISYKTAPIDVREKFYLNETQQALLLSTLQSDPAVAEAIVLSTCNRTEVYVYALNEFLPFEVIKTIASIKKIAFTEDLHKHFYQFEEAKAIEHFLRVSASLDSIVLGEKQILGQVKSAVALSRSHGMLSKHFNVLSDLAIRTGKKAQTETQIGCGGVSVSWSAIAVAQKILGSLEGKNVLIIGAGKMGHLAAENLKAKKVGHIYVMNRTEKKAEEMARQFSGTPVSFWDMKEVLSDVDVCLCSAGAPHYIVEYEHVSKAMALRPRRPLVCIDISIPRNIAPEVESLDNVSLVTVDDLGGIVAENMEKRQSALSQVELIVAQKIVEYQNKIQKIRVCEQSGGLMPAAIL